MKNSAIDFTKEYWPGNWSWLFASKGLVERTEPNLIHFLRGMRANSRFEGSLWPRFEPSQILSAFSRIL